MTGRYFRSRSIVPTACVFCCLLVAAGGPSGTFADEASSVADDVATVQPFIGETTALVFKVDPTRVAPPGLADMLKSAFPGSEEVARRIETLRVATGGQAVYATVGIPLSRNEWPAFLFLKETPDADRKQFLDCLTAFNPMESCTRHGCIVAMPGRGFDAAAAVDAIVPSQREELADALEAVEGYPIQVLLLPPGYVRRTVRELMPQLPRQLGGGPSDVLREGLIYASLGVDIARLRAELIIQSDSEEAARRLMAHLPKMLESARKGLSEVGTRIPHEAFEVLSPLVKPKVEGDRIIVRLAGPESMGESMRLVMMAAAEVQQRIYRRTNIDNFKQIMLGMLNYHSACKAFPPRDEVRDESGKSGLSWRVHLLPYFDEDELYNEFHLDEPWDSSHNKRLVEKMPNIYKSRWYGIEPGHTVFLAPVGEDTVFGGGKATRIRDISDGTSCTVLLVEVKPSLAVPWTAPVDYAFDPEDPGRGLQIGTDERFLAVFADGSVQRLRGKIEPELLRRLFRKSDGYLFRKSDGQVFDRNSIR